MSPTPDGEGVIAYQIKYTDFDVNVDFNKQMREWSKKHNTKHTH